MIVAQTMCVGRRRFPSSRKVFSADETTVHVQVCQRHGTHFFKVEFQHRSIHGVKVQVVEDGNGCDFSNFVFFFIVVVGVVLVDERMVELSWGFDDVAVLVCQ